MAKTPYSALAPVYEALLGDENYINWATYLVGLVNTYSSGKVGLDLACGSGYFTRALKKAGYHTEGVDISPEMLNAATEKARKEGLDILFRQGDMSTVKVFKKVDFITVVNDGINYIPTEKLEKTFKHFATLLKTDGVLLFDFSSEYKLRNVIGNNLFGEDTEDCAYLWFNRLDENKVFMDISVFTKDGDRYIKTEESQIQYIHTLKQVVDALEKSGYKSVIAQKHLGGKLSDTDERIQIIAKKAGK